MDLYLQLGAQMMGHCLAHLRDWGGGTVILSPRDLDRDQLQRFSGQVCALRGQVLLDPQFYLPGSDHHRLSSHEFWPQDYESGLFWTGVGLGKFLSDLRDLNAQLTCSRFILPARLCTEVDDLWIASQRAILTGAQALGIERAQLIATVALSEDVIGSVEQVHDLLQESRSWDVGAIYLVLEHPNGEYLVESPSWLANALDAIAGFRLNGFEVLVGYCNQQMLIAAAAGANAIASGNWMNVRSFPADKFRQQDEEEQRRKAVWYYCPQALSEYKRPTLDGALRLGLLGRMAPPPEMQNQYAEKLFDGGMPSASAFGERDMFRHYLHALRVQTRQARRMSYQDTVAGCDALLNAADALLNDLHRARVYEKTRDFSDALGANRQALSILERFSTGSSG